MVQFQALTEETEKVDGEAIFEQFQVVDETLLGFLRILVLVLGCCCLVHL